MARSRYKCLSLFLPGKALLLLFGFVGLSAPAMAQYAPTGITQWSTQIQTGPISIDMATGAMFANIPVRSKAGAIPFQFNLIDNFGNYGAIDNYLVFTDTLMTGNMAAAYPPKFQSCGTIGTPSYGMYYYGTFTAYDATGAKHTFGANDPIGVGVGGACMSPGPITAVADDGSGYSIVVNGNAPSGLAITLYNKDGLTGGSWGVYDPDGNSISSQHSSNFADGATSYTATATWQDTLTQTVLTESENLTCTSVKNDPTCSYTSQQFSYTDANNEQQSYTVNYTNQPVATAFGCTISGGSTDVPETTMYLPSSVVLPTGGQYTFSYEQTPGISGYVTGRLAQVTLPSGGYVAFAYGNGIFAGTNSSAGYNCVVPRQNSIRARLGPNFEFGGSPDKGFRRR